MEMKGIDTPGMGRTGDRKLKKPSGDRAEEENARWFGEAGGGEACRIFYFTETYEVGLIG